MNPIANLPATQNLNKAQQSQGYNRQYFGGDEVDEVVLSNQEEQKKKKAWTIGLTTLGTIALAVGAFVGLSATGCTKKGADNLKGFTQLTQGEGESATKLATIAKTDKSWTGATWGGVAETIKTTLDDNKTFTRIIVVATKENQKKLEDKLGKEFINKHNSNLLFRAEDDIKNVVKTYGDKKDTLILVDSSKDDWFDRIEKEITSLNKPKEANTGEAAEEKKDTHTTADEVAGEESASASAPKTEQYFNIELNSLESAQQIFTSLKDAIQKASDELKTFELPGPDNKEVQPYQFIDDFTNKFEPQFRNAMNLAKTADALEAYCANRVKELEQDNAKLNESLEKESSDKEKRLNQCTDDNTKAEITKKFEENKQNMENKITTNDKERQALKSISYNFKSTQLFTKLHNNIAAIAETLKGDFFNNKNVLTSNIQKEITSLQSDIESLQGTLNEQNEKLSNLQKQQQEKQEEDNDLSSNIQKLRSTIAQNRTKLDKYKSKLKDKKNSLEETKKALTKLFDTYCTIKRDLTSITQQEELQQAQKSFKYSISDESVSEVPLYRTSFFNVPPISDGDGDGDGDGNGDGDE